LRPVRTGRPVMRARLARPVRTGRPVMRARLARSARRPRLLTSPRRPATGQPRPTRNSRQGRESARKGRLMALTIGVDVGGTKVAAGVVDEQGRILEKLKRSTPAASPEQTATVISDTVLELLDRHQVEAVGLGAAGFVDEARATVLFAPNLAWRDEPVKKKVEDRVSLPVVVENDANATVWAETTFGAARGHDRVVPDGRLCGCGNRGCWEQYASGNALVAEAREFAARSPRGAVRLLQLGGGAPDGITGPGITRAAREGDPAALRCFEIVGSWLGHGLADIAAILDPGCFVIGGGVSEAGDLLIGPARAAFAAALTGGTYRPLAEIRLAELGPDAGLVGAADLARRG